MKNPLLYLLIACTAIVMFSDGDVKAKDPGSNQVATEEYVTIVFDGRTGSYILRPEGRLELQNLNNVNVPQHAHSQTYLMHLLIEKCAKEGYSLVAFTNPTCAVMRRKVQG